MITSSPPSRSSSSSVLAGGAFQHRKPKRAPATAAATTAASSGARTCEQPKESTAVQSLRYCKSPDDHVGDQHHDGRAGGEAIEAIGEVHRVGSAGDHDDDPHHEQHRADRDPEVGQERQLGQGVGYGSSFAKETADLPEGWTEALWTPGFREGAVVQAVCDAMEALAAQGRAGCGQRGCWRAAAICGLMEAAISWGRSV
jgi:hypothetical protein